MGHFLHKYQNNVILFTNFTRYVEHKDDKDDMQHLLDDEGPNNKYCEEYCRNS